MDTVLGQREGKRVQPVSPSLCSAHPRLPGLCVKHPLCVEPCPVCCEEVDLLGDLVVLGERTSVTRVLCKAPKSQ